MGNTAKELGLMAASAVLTFLALDSGMFDPSYDHIKAQVAAELRDPSSAQFRNIREGTEVACGEVNAKNAFGAYTGFRKFTYRGGITLLEPEQSPGFNTQQLTQFYEDQARFARNQIKCHE
jgi:hypothetical protein